MVSNSAAARGRGPRRARPAAAARRTINAIAMANIWRWPPVRVRAASRRLSARMGKRGESSAIRAGACARSRKPPISRFPARHRGEDVALLRHEGEAEPADAGARGRRLVAIPEPDMPGSRPQQPGDGLEQGRFTRAVRPDECHHLARLDPQRRAAAGSRRPRHSHRAGRRRWSRLTPSPLRWRWQLILIPSPPPVPQQEVAKLIRRLPIYASCTAMIGGDFAKLPSVSTCPSAMTITGSQSWAMKLMSCSISSTLMPRWATPAAARRSRSAASG